MIELSEKWAPRLLAQGETGMGYQICTVSLKDGQQFQKVTIVGGTIVEVPGHLVIPFAENDGQDILVTPKNVKPVERDLSGLTVHSSGRAARAAKFKRYAPWLCGLRYCMG